MIQIFPLLYKDEGKKIGIKGYIDASLKEQLTHCGLLKYSNTYKTWYLPYEKTVFDNLKARLQGIEVLVSNAPPSD